jgi:dipeptidyl aminopeptidase/acylaminoacyl peptidase
MRAETNAVYAVGPPGTPGASDYILFVRNRTLIAQPFDRQRLEPVSDAIPIAEHVGVSSPIGALSAQFSISNTGVLMYGAGDRGSQLVWFDRAGKQLASLGPPGLDIDFRISPEGRQVAAQREDDRGGADIWLLESARGTALRFTSEPAYDAAPVWSPDGMRIAFFSSRDGRWQLWEKPSNGLGDATLLLKTNTDLVPGDWSPDGRFLLYGDIDPKDRKTDLWVLPVRGIGGEPPKSIPFVHTAFDENFARFSPDGRWVAYQSDESGRNEIYVRPFGSDGAAGAGKWQISTNGGIEPRWPRAGKEIFYIGPDNMLMTVETKTGAAFEVGVPRALFPTRPVGVLRYDVAPDGQRFLVAVPTQEASSAPATIVLNWLEELKRRMPTTTN